MLESRPLTWRGFSPWQKGLLGLLIAYSVSHLAYSILIYNPITSPSISSDFYVSYLEAAHWKQTGRLELLGCTNIPYPAFFYWWLFPLTGLPYPWLSAGLYLAQFPLFAWALALLVRAAAPDSAIRPMEYLAAVLMAVNFQPLLETLSQHKAEGLEFFLVCVVILAFKEGKDAKSGAMIFLAASLKYLPGLLAPYFLLKRERRVVRGFLLTSAFCTAAFIPFFGIDAFWNLIVRQTFWVSLSRKVESNQPIASFESQSLSEIVNRFFVSPDPAHPLKEILHSSQVAAVTSPNAALWVGLALKILILGGFLAFLRSTSSLPRRGEGWPLTLLEISLALVMIPILVQSFRSHYAILLLPAFVTTGLIILRHWELVKRSEKILFSAALSLSGMLIPGGLLNRLPPHPFWGGNYSRLYQWWSFQFYGFLLLGVTILLCHTRLRSAFLRK